ncbi:MAG: hypothetical protein AAF146_15340 [Bacteroidota bacterium]
MKTIREMALLGLLTLGWLGTTSEALRAQKLDYGLSVGWYYQEINGRGFRLEGSTFVPQNAYRVNTGPLPGLYLGFRLHPRWMLRLDARYRRTRFQFDEQSQIRLRQMEIPLSVNYTLGHDIALFGALTWRTTLHQSSTYRNGIDIYDDQSRFFEALVRAHHPHQAYAELGLEYGFQSFRRLDRWSIRASYGFLLSAYFRPVQLGRQFVKTVQAHFWIPSFQLQLNYRISQ